MQISNDTVVSIDYTLKNDEGTVIDQSQPGQPLTYLHGHQNIIPGLEKMLTGKSTGDSLDVSVSPEQGYGEHNPNLEQTVPRENFHGAEDLEVGMGFHANTEHGPIPVRITKIEDNDVTVDGNHPLAGMHLNFSVTVQDIRTATQEEIQNGHIQSKDEGGCCGGHGEGGCGC